MFNPFNTILFAHFHVSSDVHHIERLIVSGRIRQWKCICYFLYWHHITVWIFIWIFIERDFQTVFLFYNFTCLYGNFLPKSCCSQTSLPLIEIHRNCFLSCWVTYSMPSATDALNVHSNNTELLYECFLL